MKKNFRLVLALVLAMMMVVGNMATMAAPGDLEHNTTLTVEGLDSGDVVKYYKILKWDQTAERVKDSNGNPIGWDWAKENPTGLTDNDLKEIVGVDGTAGAITAAMADKLAAAGFAQTGSNGTADANGKWTVSDVDAGLYMVIVEAKTSGTMYNPIFVAANFYGPNETPDSSNEIAISADELSYMPAARAKKTTIPLTKVAKGNGTTGLDDMDPDSTDVGEIIVYEVTTKIPKFPADYTNPKFALRDTLVGLTLDQNSIEVYAGSSTSGTKLVKDTAYTQTSSDTGYTITFTKTYLQSVADAGQEIFVTYKAEVSDTAEKIINQDTNTVDLIFSTSPDDTEGHGRRRDRTNHYTFSIDANLLGDSSIERSSTEAIKIGVDKDGNPVVSEQSYWEGSTYHAALAGAEFGLYKTQAGAQNETESDLYKNDVFTTGKVTSDATGRLTIKGLDEGTYWLKELKAPTGFIRWQSPIEVKIEATYSDPEVVEVTEDVDGVEVTYYTKELLTYKVTIGGSETSYTIVNSGSHIVESQVVRTPASSDKEIENIKGVELPSTGGIGTTIFYIGGSILVLAAAILLITKRRMGAED